jgi:hypothetical protein
LPSRFYVQEKCVEFIWFPDSSFSWASWVVDDRCKNLGMVKLLSALVAVLLGFLLRRNSGIPHWISSPRDGVSWFTTSRGLGFRERTCIMGGFDRLCMKGKPLDFFDCFWPLCTAHTDRDSNTRKFKEIISGYLYKWNNQFLFQRSSPLRKVCLLGDGWSMMAWRRILTMWSVFSCLLVYLKLSSLSTLWCFICPQCARNLCY